MHWERRCQIGYGLIEHSLVRLLVRHGRLGHVGNLIAATGSRRDLAVGQQQFAGMQAYPFARPINCVANPIGKINLARFGGAHYMSSTVIEVGIMPANHIITQG